MEEILTTFKICTTQVITKVLIEKKDILKKQLLSKLGYLSSSPTLCLVKLSVTGLNSPLSQSVPHGALERSRLLENHRDTAVGLLNRVIDS